MASPRTTGSISMGEFAAKLTAYANLQSKTQIEQLRQADKSFQRQLIRASREQTGGDRILDRVGPAAGFGKRKGAPLGYRRERIGRMAIEFRKTGPWQFVDNSAGGPQRTQPHGISVDLSNKRPLPPAKKYAPAMRGNRDGKFLHGTVPHPGSYRQPLWGRALYRAGVKVIDDMGHEFIKVGRQIWP